MAKITLDIPDGQIQNVLDAVCTQQGYQSVISTPSGDQPNPQSKGAFVKEYIANILIKAVIAHQGDLAADAAIKATTTNVKQNIVIT